MVGAKNVAGIPQMFYGCFQRPKGSGAQNSHVGFEGPTGPATETATALPTVEALPRRHFRTATHRSFLGGVVDGGPACTFAGRSCINTWIMAHPEAETRTRRDEDTPGGFDWNDRVRCGGWSDVCVCLFVCWWFFWCKSAPFWKAAVSSLASGGVDVGRDSPGRQSGCLGIRDVPLPTDALSSLFPKRVTVSKSQNKRKRMEKVCSRRNQKGLPAMDHAEIG